MALYGILRPSEATKTPVKPRLNPSKDIAPLAKRVFSTLEIIGRQTAERPEDVARETNLKKTGPLAAKLNAINPDDQKYVLQVFSLAMDMYDPDIERHQSRTTVLALLTARNLPDDLKPSPAQMAQLSLAARLHDLGKGGIPHDRLFSGVLKEKDQWIREYHLYHALWFLRQISWLEETAEILKYMHFFDKYPKGLSRSGMGLLPQVLSAADIFDALTNTRSYHNAASFADALCIVFERDYDNPVKAALLRVVDSEAYRDKIALINQPKQPGNDPDPKGL